MTNTRPGETPGFRDEVREFLRTELPADWRGVGALPASQREEFVASWRKRAGARGYLAVTWPEQYGGRGLGKVDHLVVVEEFSHAKVPVGTPGDTVSIKMLGSTINKWGTAAQKAHILPRIISGEDVWCQGYSEPESGSDLSSLRTRAVLRDDEWHIDGQKIWTSNADNANWMFLLARTDPDAARTKGITMLVMPTTQPGVEIRPITMLSGGRDFCEVFFTDARTPADNVVGTVNDGWTVANSLLTHERGEEAAVNPILFAHEFDRVLTLVRERGADRDPAIRARLARSYAELSAMKAMGDRILDSYIRDGSLGPAASVSKLYWSEYHQRLSSIAVDVLGSDALYWEGDQPIRWFRADDPGAPNSSASWLAVHLQNSLAGTVYAGTSEIQRNIIAERALGLPREPRQG
ncbi:acyl-CoA dehydrogenase family protein [Gordonia alkanivorans]|uniref:acyl-CoA dehydrogenase family protein n=1 Tax=Gordonia alkanivorans TaxID=84096 RepID=UPI002448C821|nr:acyl-CoA dehydrogenase family protein [Gordonia alkanivorans]MDH3047231.1 acyl-CoA dehydrogenase family protein [Gordonia alkanivorans]